MLIKNIHVNEFCELITDVQKEIENCQSSSEHRMLKKDSMRQQQYFDHMENTLELIIQDPEKDNPHGHPTDINAPDPRIPERGRNIFCNLMAYELYCMHVELVKGNSNQISAGFLPQDQDMIKEKLQSLRQYWNQGAQAQPQLHFIESIRGDSDDKKA